MTQDKWFKACSDGPLPASGETWFSISSGKTLPIRKGFNTAEPRDARGRWTRPYSETLDEGGERSRTMLTPKATSHAEFEADKLRYAPKALVDAISGEEKSTYQSYRAGPEPKLGRYQISEANLVGLGLKQSRNANGWSGTRFAQSYNIKTDHDFLFNPDAQDAAMGQFAKNVIPSMDKFYNQYGNLPPFLGTDGDPIEVTKGGLMMALHHGSPTDVSDYFNEYEGKNTFGVTLNPDTSFIERRLRIGQDVPYNP